MSTTSGDSQGWVVALDFARIIDNAVQVGDDLLLDFGRDTVTLLDANVNELTFDHFIF